LFIKVTERRIELLLLLENWFRIGVTCVKWGHVFSAFYKVSVEFDKAVFFRLIYLQCIIIIIIINIFKVA